MTRVENKLANDKKTKKRDWLEELMTNWMNGNTTENKQASKCRRPKELMTNYMKFFFLNLFFYFGHSLKATGRICGSILMIKSSNDRL